MAFLEFCCRAGGNNLNAGTLNGGSTEPAVTAAVTYTGGDWNGSNIYTAPVGADLTEAVAGRYVALCPDGATVPAVNAFSIHRILSVNAGTRQITVRATTSYVGSASWGTVQGSSTGNKTLRIGGAWLGPNGANSFPLNAALAWQFLNDYNGYVRVNLKNDQTYTVSVALNGSAWNVSGYGSTFGDHQRATIDGGTSGASYTLFSTNFGDGATLVSDLIFQNNGATGSANGVSIGNANYYGLGANLVVKGMRGYGLVGASTHHECEAYNNGAGGGGGISSGFAINCIAHNNTGPGFGSNSYFINCIADSNTSHGFWSYSNRSAMRCLNCDAYGNGGSGFYSELVNGGSTLWQNCNAVSNSAYGFRNIESSSGSSMMTMLNCGTFGNTSGAILSSGGASTEYLNTGHIAYASNPFIDAPNGDFRRSLAASKNAGRSRFVQTDSGYAGAIGYPDIGACQSLGGSSMPFSRLINGTH